jgi:hypothetical protein
MKRKKSKKPMSAKERERKLAEARTLGMEELGWVHGGGVSTEACCTWKCRVNLT